MKICNEALQAAGFPDIFFLFNDAGTETRVGASSTTSAFR